MGFDVTTYNPLDRGFGDPLTGGKDGSRPGDVPPILKDMETPITANKDVTANVTASPEQQMFELIKDILDKNVKDGDRTWNLILKQSGYELDPDGNPVRMSEEKYLANMNPIDRANYERQLKLNAREDKALAGELELPVGMQQAMDEQRKNNESLLAQKLGTDWQLSTAGIQNKSKQNAIELAATDAFRRGEVQLGMSLLSNNQALMNNSSANLQNTMTGYQNRNMGAANGYGGLFNTFNQNSQNERNRDAQLYMNQQNNKSAETAGLYSLLGTGLGLAGGYALKCWVAREVYGADNPKWLMFREWLDNKSPKWFYDLYMKHGERFAKFIHNKPTIKYFIKLWMDSRINMGVSYGRISV